MERFKSSLTVLVHYPIKHLNKLEPIQRRVILFGMLMVLTDELLLLEVTVLSTAPQHPTA